MGPRHPARSENGSARVDAQARGRADARAASGRFARSRQANLGAPLSRALGAAPRRSGRHARSNMRVAMLVRCLAMMRGGGETRHLAWVRELTALGVDVHVY